mmetsp:Transcript_4851/g.7382  ORF Transcript_4851/g.7382 Transcript_4851/m.7382 type:complete len:403 (+) Transcript_4851:51-1259(+)
MSSDLSNALQEGDIDTIISHLLPLISTASNEKPLHTHSNTHNDTHQTTSDLKKLKDLLVKCTTRLSHMISMESNKSLETTMTSSGSSLLTIEGAQFIEPRGRVDTTISDTGLFMQTKTENCFIKWENVETSILLPSPNCAKKEGEVLLFLHMRTPVVYKTKPLNIICWNLSNGGKDYRAQFSLVHFTGKESVVVGGLVQALLGRPHAKENAALFQSSTGTSFLRCHKGVKEGVLFPLEVGILFFKPPLFLPRDNVASITAGRGGSAMTRYIDLTVETEDGKTYEYSNIERDDLPAIEAYVRMYVQRRLREEKRRSAGVDGTDEINESDSEDDDEDFDPDAPESADEGSDNDSSSDSESGSVNSEAESDDETRDNQGKGTAKSKKRQRNSKVSVNRSLQKRSK